jgi:cyclopropane-fatty-acyl-phospholipid synthase
VFGRGDNAHMLYRFQSRATSDLIMLEPQGRLFLEILDKPVKGPGILVAADLPAAIQKIEAAIQAEDTQKTQAQGAPHVDAEEAPEKVWLRQRAKPLLDLLRRSLAAQQDVVWGL